LPCCKEITGGSFDKITIPEVTAVINKNVNHKAPGPSGIAPLHLKYICDKYEKFVNILVEIFNMILCDPKNVVPKIESLYEFRACFLPKNNN
jgi:hypothetical protein